MPRGVKRTEPLGTPAAPVEAVSAAGFVTTDGNLALSYIGAGGRLVSVTKQYPDRLFKPGKRYVFLESEGELQALLANQEAA